MPVPALDPRRRVSDQLFGLQQNACDGLIVAFVSWFAAFYSFHHTPLPHVLLCCQPEINNQKIALHTIEIDTAAAKKNLFSKKLLFCPNKQTASHSDANSKEMSQKKPVTPNVGYMNHSAMNELYHEEREIDPFAAPSGVLMRVGGSAASSAARAKKTNLTAAEQKKRSAEMKKTVLQTEAASGVDPTWDTEMQKAIYYSGTDTSEQSADEQTKSKKSLFVFGGQEARKANSEAMALVNAQQTNDSANSCTVLLNASSKKTNELVARPCKSQNVCSQTLSTAMQEKNYKSYGISSYYRDTQYEEDLQLERRLMGVATRSLCRLNGGDDSKAEDLQEASRQIATAGLGTALVTVTSLCASAQTRRESQPCNLTAAAFDYPLSTDACCFFDHEPFHGVPIFIPLAFYDDKQMISILSSICFCSFSCALGYIKQKAPSMLRSNNSHTMLSIFARRYFGMTEEISDPQPLIMLDKFLGPLTIDEWRLAATTHRSMLRQPLSVAAPATVITEVHVRSRKHAGQVARITQRTEETHFNAIPQRPERNSPDAADAAKRKLKEGKGRPLKQRQIVDENGNVVAIDDARINAIINESAEKKKSEQNSSQPIVFVKPTASAKKASRKRKSPAKPAAAEPAKQALPKKKKQKPVKAEQIAEKPLDNNEPTKKAKPVKKAKRTATRSRKGAFEQNSDANMSLSRFFAEIGQ